MATSASNRETDKFRTPTKGCTGRTTRRCGPFCVPAQGTERIRDGGKTQTDAPTHCRKTETAGRDSGLYSAESTRVLAAEYADGLRMAQRREAHGRHGHPRETEHGLACPRRAWAQNKVARKGNESLAGNFVLHFMPAGHRPTARRSFHAFLRREVHARHAHVVVGGILHDALPRSDGGRLVHVISGADFGMVLLQGQAVH